MDYKAMLEFLDRSARAFHYYYERRLENWAECERLSAKAQELYLEVLEEAKEDQQAVNMAMLKEA